MLPEKVEANQRIRRTQAELGLDDVGTLPFLCECVDVRCRTLTRLTAEDYDAVRSESGTCIVARGHAYRGRVVREGDGYTVVEH
jgi:hypothetical protein